MAEVKKTSGEQSREAPAAFVPPGFQLGPVTTALQLGPLASLVGSWRGTGFNVM